MADYEVVTDEGELASLVASLCTLPHYAIDTEFHRERTYWPKLALVQLAGPDGVSIVDPLEIDIAPLADLFRSSAVAVLHAADQDLEVLEVACGAAPEGIFDTQVAAGFLGHSSPSLLNLHESMLGIRLPKGDRLTDWLRRPLEPRQLDYAAADVSHLLEIYRIEVDDLEARGRLDWAQDECDALVRRPRGPRDPDDAWLRIKEARQLQGRARAVAQAIAAWREERARDSDQPPRFVLSDLGVVSVAQRAPKTLAELRKSRGVDGRHINNGAGEEILAAVEAAGSRPKQTSVPVKAPELERELRPVVQLVAAWASQLGRELDLDAALLATRSDIEAFLRGDDEARLATGWRAELLGDPIGRLVKGDAALAFVRGRGLVLEDRP